MWQALSDKTFYRSVGYTLTDKIFYRLLYTPLDIVYVLFETFFVCIKARESFEVVQLQETSCTG